MTKPKANSIIRNAVVSLLSGLSGQDNTLVIPRAFIALCNGNHLQALLLSQILYWSDRSKDTDGWFAKSYEDWFEELCMTEYQVRRAIEGDKRTIAEAVRKQEKAPLTLEDLGVETETRRSNFYNGGATKHYRINAEKFANWIMNNVQEQTLNNVQELSLNNVQNAFQTMFVMTLKTMLGEYTETPETPTEIIPETTPEAGGGEPRPILFQEFENRFGVLTGNGSERLKQWGAEYPLRWCLKALDITKQTKTDWQGKRKRMNDPIAYAESILERWYHDGYDGDKDGAVPSSKPVKADEPAYLKDYPYMRESKKPTVIDDATRAAIDAFKNGE
jgi:hypothetical protein